MVRDLQTTGSERGGDASDNIDWDWTILFTNPAYTLLAGMACGFIVNLFMRHLPAAAYGPRTQVTAANSSWFSHTNYKMVLVVRTDIGMSKVRNEQVYVDLTLIEN